MRFECQNPKLWQFEDLRLLSRVTLWSNFETNILVIISTKFSTWIQTFILFEEQKNSEKIFDTIQDFLISPILKKFPSKSTRGFFRQKSTRFFFRHTSTRVFSRPKSTRVFSVLNLRKFFPSKVYSSFFPSQIHSSFLP